MTNGDCGYPCLMDRSLIMKRNGNKNRKGFSLAEVILVVIIIAVAAMIAVPMFSSASGLQLSSAANMVAADLEYAKSLAITNQEAYSIVFDAAGDSYQMLDSTDAVVEDPVRTGMGVAVDFTTDSRFNQVDIVSVSFGSTGTIDTVEFDYLGAPYDGDFDPLTSDGEIVLTAGQETITIIVKPVTGYIIIQ